MKEVTNQSTVRKHDEIDSNAGDLRAKGAAGTSNPENEDGKVKPPTGAPDHTEKVKQD